MFSALLSFHYHWNSGVSTLERFVQAFIEVLVLWYRICFTSLFLIAPYHTFDTDDGIILPLYICHFSTL